MSRGVMQCCLTRVGEVVGNDDLRRCRKLIKGKEKRYKVGDRTTELGKKFMKYLEEIGERWEFLVDDVVCASCRSKIYNKDRHVRATVSGSVSPMLEDDVPDSLFYDVPIIVEVSSVSCNEATSSSEEIVGGEEEKTTEEFKVRGREKLPTPNEDEVRKKKVGKRRRRNEEKLETIRKLRKKGKEEKEEMDGKAKEREERKKKRDNQHKDTFRRGEARKRPAVRQRDNDVVKKMRAGEASWDENKRRFLEGIKEGPSWICSCCGSLWFRSSISEVKEADVQNSMTEDFASRVLNIGMMGKHYACFTCLRSIKRKQIPKLCLSNGLDFPVIPEELRELTTLEERLCALRLPFLQIRSLGVDRQCGLKGNVVHIPNELESTIGKLPRKMKDSDIIPVQLMRKMEHERPYIFQVIRPKKVVDAVRYLLRTPIYIEEGVTLSEDWEAEIIEELEVLISSMPVQKMTDEEDQECREEVNPGGQETMLMNDLSSVLRIAPGEGKKPMSLINDLNGEVAAYPSIYCGILRQPGVKLTYCDIVKSETRRYDRRFEISFEHKKDEGSKFIFWRRCAVPHKLLHAYKIKQNHEVVNAVSLCLRKKVKRKITANDLLNGESVDQLISADVGFQLLKQVRTSPAFWEQKQKNILAMIRQLGIPTLFVTLSAAETHWPELLVVLAKILDNETLKEEEAASMKYEQKASLIRRDPVTCARYFDYRLKQCFNHLLKPMNGVFGRYTLKDFYSRIEFQHRGSPHAHMLLWLDSAPVYNPEDSDKIGECISLIDGLISCEANVDGVIHQQHRHTRTCRRTYKGAKICRFGIPYPPMKSTVILNPFPSGYPKGLKNSYQKKWDKINSVVEEIQKLENRNVSYEEFLKTVQVTEDEYIKILRSKLKRPTVFLKRSMNSTATNAFIPELAKVWKSNMDAQFILEPYGCAKYIAAYINKSCGGVSKLLNSVAQEADRNCIKGLEKLRKLGNTFLNHSEVSAQEAAYGVLGMPLTKASRSVIFIPTGPPAERTELVKSMEELKKLGNESEDVFVTGLLEQYSLRPEDLETMCLADFASKFQFSSKKPNQRPPELNEEEPECDEEVPVEDVIHCGENFQLKQGRGWIRRRKTDRIIRYRRYGEETDYLNFCRERLMLFVPWRDEESELGAEDVARKYVENVTVIEEGGEKYNRILCEVDPNAEADSEDEDSIVTDEEYEVMNDGDLIADLGIELGLGGETKSKAERVKAPVLIDEDQYLSLIDVLNERQANYVLHVLIELRGGKKISDFVYGGAGVGKSKLIDAIVQTITRYCQKPGSDPSRPKVLLAASTGKAAYNIKGSTIHHCFLLPINQFSGKLSRLPDDVCNSLACQLQDLELVIIDEISMVSSKQFYQINSRLQQIFKSHERFGGKSVIVVGDLRQLKPVAAKYIFEPVEGEIGAILGNPLWEGFLSYELTEIMRQKGDAVFAQALNRLSVGKLTEEDIELFRNREVTDAGPFPDDAIFLYCRNKAVDKKNETLLKKMKTEKVTSLKIDRCQGKGKAEWKTAILDSVEQLDMKDTMGLPKVVDLVVGAKYMVTLNVDVGDGLTNGATGVLKQISYGSRVDGIRVPVVAWLKFKDDEIGRMSRKRLVGTNYTTNADEVPIVIEKRMIKKWPGRDLEVIRTQFPLTPAEAMTVWKAQGDSYSQVVVFLDGMDRKALYVAFSRATKVTGLHIVGNFTAPSCPPNDPVEIEMQKVKARTLKLETNPNARNIILDVLNETRGAYLRKTVFIENKCPEKELATNEIGVVPQDSVVVVSAGHNIYSSDIRSLEIGQWLTSKVVDVFIDLIAARSRRNRNLPTFHNFGSHFWIVAKSDPTLYERSWEVEYSNVLMSFGICQHGHWTVALADHRTMKITYFDSRNGFHNQEALESIQGFLDKLEIANSGNRSAWTIKREEICQTLMQRNGSDCGAYVCMFLEAKSRNAIFSLNRGEVTESRKFIKDSIFRNTVNDFLM